MSEERVTESTASQASVTKEETTVSLTEGQKLANYMEDVFNKLSKKGNVNVMLISKNYNFIRSNLILKQALEKSGCVLDFVNKARILLEKLFPDDPIESIRIKGRKSNEIFYTYDDQLDIIVIQNMSGQ